MTSYNFVIFHKGCFDGFTSFIISTKTNTITSDAIIHPDVPSAKFPPQNIKNKNILIMDVAYKYEVLKSICDEAKSVTFIDHHITIRDDVKKMSESMIEKKINIIYDEMECGASLTWKFFYPHRKMPLFVKYIKDNDIGIWKLKYTHAFIASLDTNFDMSLTNKNLKKWHGLFNMENIKKLIKRGKVYEEYIDNLLRSNSKKYSMMAFPSEKIYEENLDLFKKPAQYKVAVVCGSGCPSTTLLGLKIMETIDCDFAIMWSLHLDRREYVLAFRSKKVDVGNIAKMFGGGGHTLAAACSFPMSKYNITDLFFPQSLPRQSLS